MLPPDTSPGLLLVVLVDGCPVRRSRFRSDGPLGGRKVHPMQIEDAQEGVRQLVRQGGSISLSSVPLLCRDLTLVRSLRRTATTTPATSAAAAERGVEADRSHPGRYARPATADTHPGRPRTDTGPDPARGCPDPNSGRKLHGKSHERNPTKVRPDCGSTRQSYPTRQSFE